MELLKTLAAPYAALLARRCGCCEAMEGVPTEAHLQALWQTDACRPRALQTVDGTALVVLEKGVWNHGEGPDFKNALLAFDGRLVRGDIECHRVPRDWDLHQHAKNPAFDHVVLHLTWGAEPPAKTLPPNVATVALAPLLGEEGISRSLQKLALPPSPDLGAPCQAYYHATPLARDRLLVSAGYHRFLLKAQQFLEKSACVTPFQAFYEGLMRAMGYQRNAATFTRLAREYPFERFVDVPALQRFAILAGVSGLLTPDARELWDLWWQYGTQPPMEPFQWDYRALRPQNHPYRRLAGGIGVLNEIAMLLTLPLAKLSTAIQSASNLLASALRLEGTLIGASRANALVNNLFVPYLLATGRLSPVAINDLKGEGVSAPMREVWLRLMGVQKGLPKDALRQQGLLQIYHDFCHNDHIVCATCPLVKTASESPLQMEDEQPPKDP